jgi:hypothetical protein
MKSCSRLRASLVLLIVWMATLPIRAQAPPVNDECTGAIFVSDGANGPFNNGFANTSTTVTCGTSALDVWYRYIATRTGTYTINTCTPTGQTAGSMVDTVLSVHASCITGATVLACNDNSCASRSSLTLSLTQGISYWIRIAGGDATFPLGTFWLSILPPPPPNDDCSTSPIALSDGINPSPPAGQSGYWFSDVNAGTSQSIPTACPAFNEVWFTYVASQTGPTTISTCTPPGFAPGSLANTIMSVHPAACSAAIACNDESCGSLASVTFDAVAATTYRIQVGGLSVQSEGTFYITVRAPANDACADAIPITGGSVTGNNGLAVTENIPVASCGSNPGKDVWYTYQNPTSCSRQVTLSLCPADGGAASFDTVLRVFSGAACSSLTEIACNDDFCGPQSRLTFTADPGVTYRVAVSSEMSGGAGPFTLDVSHTSAMSIQVAPGCTQGGTAGPTLSSNAPVLGATLTLSITSGGANTGGVLFYAPPLGGSTPLPGGCIFSLDPSTYNIFVMVATNGSGAWSLPLPLPNDATLECASVDLQALLFPGPTYKVTSCLRLVLGY